MHSSLPPSLSPLSHDELADLLRHVLASERASTLDSIRLFIEMERRQTYAAFAHDSLFTYCVSELHLSEGYTFRRLTAAKLLSRFPALEPFLADGRISLSNLVLLKDALSPDNHLALLERASHRSKQQLKELLAELNPRPDVADSIRRTPTRSPLATAPAAVFSEAASVDAVVSPQVVALDAGSCPAASPVAPAVAAASAPPVHPAATRAPADTEPLSPGRYLLKTTISADTRSKLERVQAALSHLIPDGNLEDVLDEALNLALSVLAKQHRTAAQVEAVKPVTFAAKVEARDTSEVADGDDQDAHSRHISAEVKRAVRIRDEDCCTFVGANGKRCGSTHQLEFHHRVAHALGGSPSVHNITLHCRAHNRFQAVIDFGAEHMARFSRRLDSDAEQPAAQEAG